MSLLDSYDQDRLKHQIEETEQLLQEKKNEL